MEKLARCAITPPKKVVDYECRPVVCMRVPDIYAADNFFSGLYNCVYATMRSVYSARALHSSRGTTSDQRVTRWSHWETRSGRFARAAEVACEST